FSTSNYGFQPGAEMNIKIRGTGSLNGGEPYVVIDGIPGDMNRINPEDIASISILKDAAASAIYGARAPYGVILITTKSGSTDEKLRVSYGGNVSVATPQRLPSMLNSYTHARVVNEAGVYGAGGRVFSNETIDRIIAYQRGDFEYLKQFTVPDAIYFETVPLPNGTWGINHQGNANYDWIDEYYGSSVNHKHDLSVQGGSGKTSYYLSGGYVDQEGVLNYGTDTYSRINVLAKIKTALAPWWDLGYQPRFMKSKRVRPSMDKQGEYDLVFHQIARTMPTNAKYDAYGNLMIQSKIPWINDAGNDHIETTESWQNFYTEIRPHKNWKINADFAYQSTNIFRSHQEFIVYETLVDKSIVPTSNTIPSNIRQYHHNDNYWTSNIYTTFNTNLGEKQHVTLLAGTQFEKSNNRALDVYKTNMLVQTVPSLQTATGDPSAMESLGHWSTQGYFVRMNYDFDNRYLLEVNIRRDGTSRFRKGNRWGTFPSLSLGWNISNEPFWDELRPVINMLKIRGSWGRLGNQNVASYSDLNLIPLQTSPLNWIFGFGQSRPIGYTTVPGLVSPNLTWETATTKDIGLDFVIMNRKLAGSFDWFERTTTDMIGPAEAQPGVLGIALPRANNSAFRTRGWELSLQWNQQLNQAFSYYVTGTLYDSRSFVTKYVNPTGTLSTWYVGREEGEIWGYTAERLYRTEAEIEQHQANIDLSFIWNGVWKTGDVRYEDINGDGKVNNGRNTIDDHGDLKIIGNSNPRYQYGLTFGFNWKNLDFSMLWKGTAKRDLFFAPNDNIFWGFRHFNQVSLFERHLDYFRDQEGDKYTGLYEGADNINLDSYWPRPYVNDPENTKNRQNSTKYLQSAAYLRLQNIQLGYNLPSKFTSKIKLQRARFYISGENLLTITKLPAGIDPLATESSFGAGKTYGADRILSLGLTVTY
ncbi:MAG: SusC/RagA family TonB-linked outer membrane protein, partial [Spirosomataceae bacterium]